MDRTGSEADGNLRHVNPELTLVDVLTIRQFLEQGDELCASTLCAGGTDELYAGGGTNGERVIENVEDLDTGDGLGGRDSDRTGNGDVSGSGAHDTPFSGRRRVRRPCLSYVTHSPIRFNG